MRNHSAPHLRQNGGQASARKVREEKPRALRLHGQRQDHGHRLPYRLPFAGEKDPRRADPDADLRQAESAGHGSPLRRAVSGNGKAALFHAARAESFDPAALLRNHRRGNVFTAARFCAGGARTAAQTDQRLYQRRAAAQRAFGVGMRGGANRKAYHTERRGLRYGTAFAGLCALQAGAAADGFFRPAALCRPCAGARAGTAGGIADALSLCADRRSAGHLPHSAAHCRAHRAADRESVFSGRRGSEHLRLPRRTARYPDEV